MMLWCERLVAMTLLLQSCEILSLRSRVMSIFGRDPRSLHYFQIMMSLNIILYPHAILAAGLLFCCLSNWRIFRGPFNGGSDYMTFQILLGISFWEFSGHSALAEKLGLGYIAAQLVLSYFISGVVKLKSPEWRQGQVLGAILSANYYPIPQKRPSFLQDQRNLQLLSWAALAFECLFPLSLAGPVWAAAFLTSALAFHLSVFYLLGLNRFIFSWLSAFPALWYWAVA